MKDENEPVADDELVIRAIWTGFYNPKLPLPITPSAFLPRSDETDGISVFRAACVASPEEVLVVFAEGKRDSYALAMISIAELTSLGLTVRPARVDVVAGHAVLPEVNIVEWSGNKARYRDLQTQLAACANTRIVRAPIK